MQTIRELLDRIRWDKDFGQGEFEIGFLDHVEDKIIRLPIRELTFVPGDHFFFHYLDENGEAHNVPLHRIKSVYKNAELIWHREH